MSALGASWKNWLAFSLNVTFIDYVLFGAVIQNRDYLATHLLWGQGFVVYVVLMVPLTMAWSYYKTFKYWKYRWKPI